MPCGTPALRVSVSELLLSKRTLIFISLKNELRKEQITVRPYEGSSAKHDQKLFKYPTPMQTNHHNVPLIDEIY